MIAAVEQHDLEGIVAKRKRDPYRGGAVWWKIKNPAYSQAVARSQGAGVSFAPIRVSCRDFIIG